MFTSKTECRQYVADCLGMYVNDYDIDAIIDAIFEYDNGEYNLTVDEGEFWDVVAEYDISE